MKNSLQFTMFPWPPERSNWCWAVVSASVARYYKNPRSWTPCLIANHVLKSTTCCTGAAPDCDIATSIDSALKAAKHLARGPVITTVKRAALASEIKAKRPLVLWVRWFGEPADSVGHFVVLVGTDVANDRYKVIDPKHGEWVGGYDELRASYLDRGKWEATYFTTKQSG